MPEEFTRHNRVIMAAGIHRKALELLGIGQLTEPAYPMNQNDLHDSQT